MRSTTFGRTRDPHRSARPSGQPSPAYSVESAGEAELVAIGVKDVEVPLTPGRVGGIRFGPITMTGCDGVHIVGTLDVKDDATPTSPRRTTGALQVDEVGTDLQRCERCIWSAIHRVETQPVVELH